MDIAAVMLAAGESRRFGSSNKLLARVGGEPIIARLARALDRSLVTAIIVVTPPEQQSGAREIATALAPLGLRTTRLVENVAPARGMGSSIAAGVRALSTRHHGALIVPGDMPALNPAVIDRLIPVFIAAGGEAVVHAADRDGRQRNPVIWPRRLFPALAALDGETGGKPIIAAERAAGQADAAARVIAVPFDDDTLFCDIDTVADLARWL